jgi:hypothetical protein
MEAYRVAGARMSEKIGEFSVISCGELSLVDLDAYVPLGGEDWTPRELDIHFRDQMRLGALLIWNTHSGADEYCVRVRKGYSKAPAFREAWGWIKVSTGRLHITAGDSLWGPSGHDLHDFERDQNFLIDPGHYRARIMQMYEPSGANMPSVPAFIIELEEGIGPTWGAAAWSREMWWHSHCIYDYRLPATHRYGPLIKAADVADSEGRNRSS